MAFWARGSQTWVSVKESGFQPKHFGASVHILNCFAILPPYPRNVQATRSLTWIFKAMQWAYCKVFAELCQPAWESPTSAVFWSYANQVRPSLDGYLEMQQCCNEQIHLLSVAIPHTKMIWSNFSETLSSYVILHIKNWKLSYTDWDNRNRFGFQVCKLWDKDHVYVVHYCVPST